MERRSGVTHIIEEWMTPANKHKRFHDPWIRFEAWRYLPEYSFRAKIPHLFPGFLLGIGAFILLATVEEVYYYRKNDPKNSTVLWYRDKGNDSGHH